MSGQFDRAELKAYLTRNKYEIILQLAMLGGVLILYSCVFFLLAENLKLNQGLAGFDYRYVVLSDEPAGSNVYIKYDNLCTVKQEERSINVNTYMQNKDMVYRQGSPLCYETLASNEILVSQKVAQRLNVSVGSYVKLDFILSEGETQYVVKDIFEYVTDFYRFDENSDFSVVLIGYDEDRSEQYRKQYVSFLAEEELQDYQDNDYSYKELFYLASDKAVVERKCAGTELLMLGLHVLTLGVYFVAVRKNVMCEMKKYRYDGFSRESIAYFIRAYRRRFIMIPWTVWMLCISVIGHGMISWKLWLPGFMLELLLYCLLWMRNDVYGKGFRVCKRKNLAE